jgi:plastocyanin
VDERRQLHPHRRLIDLGNRIIGEMRPGQSVSYRFTNPGTYHYDCSLHPQDMRGMVIVT